MDDATFDQKTAVQWINSIESSKVSVRDADIYPRLKSWVDRVSPREILEIGCGQGACSDKIDLIGRTYTGLEPSMFLVERAKELYPDSNRRFVVGSAYAMPFSNGAYDAAFSVAVWHLLSDLKKAAGELSRVLKAGAEFVIISANPAAYDAWTEVYTETRRNGLRFEGKLRLVDGSESQDVLYLHSLDEISESLRAAQLEILETDTFRVSDKSRGHGLFVSIRGRRV